MVKEVVRFTSQNWSVLAIIYTYYIVLLGVIVSVSTVLM